MFENMEIFERGFEGRLSPGVKENIYREYLNGMSVKNLSLKYGILGERVKAIVHQKFLYWNEVYPRLGETHMRLAYEREGFYASDFPFIEYGQDLQVMAQIEKGSEVVKITPTNYDANPKKEQKKRIYRELHTLRARKGDRIPFALKGRGVDAYLMQEEIVHRGKRAPRVNRTFQDIAKFYGTDREQMLKTKIRDRMDKGGIRFASLGVKYSA
mmetsp:Transcript_16347/g.25272  ORF Transcript_16347/g.25272 Transcript_16347/m.25272 type:complete len:213 (-) Transcript_16347:10-648(-)